MYASFRYRDAFKIQQLDETELSSSFLKSQPILESELKKIKFDDLKQKSANFKCPISGEFLQDPVTLSGYVYNRSAIEDFLFENDWTDPAALYF